MRVPPALRRCGLTLHVLSSVGWVGAVVVYLALGAGAVWADDPALTRAAYVSMDWAAWLVLVPLAVTSLVTGVVQALATPWGLFRHYWVIVKLVIALVATGVLLVYTQTLASFAETAALPAWTAADQALLASPSVVLHTVGALVLLGMATVLAVYKPAGLTRHGQRQRRRGALGPT